MGHRYDDGHRGSAGHYGEPRRGEHDAIRDRPLGGGRARDREHDDDRMFGPSEREHRAFDRDEDMGGAGWSGSSGRGGMSYRGGGGGGGDREHHGFSNYAGGGERDMGRPSYPVPGRDDRFRSERDGAHGAPGGRGGHAGHGMGQSSMGGRWDEGRFAEAATGRGYAGYRPDAGGREGWATMQGHGQGRDRGVTSSDMGLGWRAEDEDRGPHWGKGPKGYRRSDERIREDVCDAIALQGHVDATDVEVRVENAIVVLAGTVGQRQDKRRLEQLVERVHGVDDVRNEIRVRRDEGQGAQRARHDLQPQHAQQPAHQGPASGGGPNGNRTARS